MNAHGNIQSLLQELGKAHKDGAFAVSSSAVPWKSPAPRSVRRTGGILHWSLRTVPLAAAAAVALMVARPSWFRSADLPELADGTPPVVPAGEAHAIIPVPEDDCVRFDFNGDGVANGHDVQGFIDGIATGRVSPQEAERFAHCIVGA